MNDDLYFNLDDIIEAGLENWYRSDWEYDDIEEDSEDEE
jgi:hypothetical protein